MSPSTGQKTWQAILNAEPALAALFSRSPRYRYFSHGQRRYCWTTEPFSDGRYAAFEYRPVGLGARSGTATQLKIVREVRFRTRKAAKARANKWHDDACAPKATP